MRTLTIRWLLWIPPLLWMAAIYLVSGDAESAQRSSRIIGPLVRWLVPDISEDALWTVVLIVRKGAHLTEYAVLSILVFVALHGLPIRSQTNRRRSNLALAFVLSTAYACTDELHQSLVPNRIGAFTDVLIDALGAALGLALLQGLCLRKRTR